MGVQKEPGAWVSKEPPAFAEDFKQRDRAQPEVLDGDVPDRFRGEYHFAP